jgi:hypothetical protein
LRKINANGNNNNGYSWLCIIDEVPIKNIEMRRH